MECNRGADTGDHSPYIIYHNLRLSRGSILNSNNGVDVKERVVEGWGVDVFS